MTYTYEVGTAIADITAFKKGVGMMGYGMYFNKVHEKGTGLNARAFVIRNINTGKKVVFVNAEIAFITISIKRGVIKNLSRHYSELGFQPENVFLSAQHTHSGPGGYSHYGFYNFSVPGFVPEVYQQIVDGITHAIVEADRSLQPAKIYLSKGTFASDVEVAFNRSVRAYNKNPEAKKYEQKDWHLALDRDMLLLRFDALDGKPIGTINWFGVHCTSVHNDNRAICFDNKGYAAQFMEDAVRKYSVNNKFVSAFAQGAAGDVSPNYILDKKKKWTRGKYEDDFESARHNGKLQYEKAIEIFDAAHKGEELKGDIDFALMHSNFGNILPDAEFTNGARDARTSPSCHGVGFLKGTVEGPGLGIIGGVAANALADFLKAYHLSKSVFKNAHEREKLFNKYKAQGKKKIIIETGERKILGTRDLKNLLLPAWADKSVAAIKKHYRNGSLDNKPWTPQVLPLQIVTIGSLALVGIPGEITTVAGWRLRDTIYNVLKKKGITNIILTSYSNDYSGYITTFEEYQEQCYEGGHTVYGQWTLAAFQTKFKQLATEMLKHPIERSISRDEEPVMFTDEELMKRSFSEA
ncbi:MAG: neutral/alkaline non-lysosomal ceramidase N-terminal domain-containing protein [Chitinophagales bacterium]|nr:neutral/alkaline non-lysosomal ceramidase N-terminal domain-containing protein [Chitinophagales bacterium]